MKNNFIKLNLENESFCYVNSSMITSIIQENDLIRISTLGGEFFMVKNSMKEIFELIEKSEFITLKNY